MLGGDFNVAPSDADVWDAKACQGGTHVSQEERSAIAELLGWGLVDAYRLQRVGAGPVHVVGLPRRRVSTRTSGMRIDHLFVSRARGERAWCGAEIDREARKGKPIPSDHAPLVIDRR